MNRNTNYSKVGYKRPHYGQGSQGITHIDGGALEWMDSKGCKTLLDVGCGTGGQVQVALGMGWGAFGIDVDDTVHGDRNVALIDLCVNPVIFHKPFDLVWSVETAEHIPEEYEDNFIETLTSNSESYIILTASMADSQPAHVNCKPRDYWISRIEKEGFNYSEELYQELIEHSTMKRKFIKCTGMIFKRI